VQVEQLLRKLNYIAKQL